MLVSFVKHLLHPRAPAAETPKTDPVLPLRLHVGGRQPHPDWKILTTEAGDHVDYLRSCTDLSPFAAGSVTEIYASHVLEHLGYQGELQKALSEFHRVLEPGGALRVSVPDLETLCALFLDPALDMAGRFHVMRCMYGGQLDDSDFHLVGLTHEFLASYLRGAGFRDIERVEDLGLFDDTSRLVLKGRRISLNLVAKKPMTEAGPPVVP